jgi:hypothetical protein
MYSDAYVGLRIVEVHVLVVEMKHIVDVVVASLRSAHTARMPVVVVESSPEKYRVDHHQAGNFCCGRSSGARLGRPIRA